MNSELLKVESRKNTGSRASNRLRKSGYVPAIICSKGEETISIKLNKASFRKSISKLGRSTVFNLEIDSKNTISAMVRDIQYLPMTNELLNITFQKVSLKEEIKTNVAVRVINTENLEFNKFRISMHAKTLPVTGLPADIPNHIDIDGTNLQGGDNFFVKDLILPEKITTDADPEMMILSVLIPKAVETDEDTEDKDTEDVEEITEEVE